MRMKTVYLNMRDGRDVETVDEFTETPELKGKAFRIYVRSMIDEYRIARMNVYKSSRPCKSWREK